jgi:hypothetical protein
MKVEKEMKMIKNTLVKSKAEVRAEGEAALAEFLRRGGVVTVVENKRRAPKVKMAVKSSKSFKSGTAPFGYTKSNVFK